MSGFDVVILIIIILALIRGFIKGFIMQLAGLVALLLGIYIAVRFSAYLGEILYNKVQWNQTVVRWLAFAILFALVVVAVHFAGKGAEKLAKITQLSFLNRFAGAVFSGIKTVFVLAVLLFLFTGINQRFQFFSAEKINKSKFYSPLGKIIPALFPRFIHKPQQPVNTEEIVVDLENASIIKGKYYLCENFVYDLG